MPEARPEPKRHEWNYTQTSNFVVGGVRHTDYSWVCKHCGVHKPLDCFGENQNAVCPDSRFLSMLLTDKIKMPRRIFAQKNPNQYPEITWQIVIGGLLPTYIEMSANILPAPKARVVVPIEEGTHFCIVHLDQGDKVLIPETGNPVVYRKDVIIMPFCNYSALPVVCPMGASVLRLEGMGQVDCVGIEIT